MTFLSYDLRSFFEAFKLTIVEKKCNESCKLGFQVSPENYFYIFNIS